MWLTCKDKVTRSFSRTPVYRPGLGIKQKICCDYCNKPLIHDPVNLNNPNVKATLRKHTCKPFILKIF